MAGELALAGPFHACVNHDPPVPKPPACMDKQLAARLGAGSASATLITHYNAVFVGANRPRWTTPRRGAGFSVRQEVDDLIYGRVARHRGCVLRLDGSVIDPAGGLEVVRTGRPPPHEPVGDHTQAGLRRDGLLGGVREELVPPLGLALGGAETNRG